MLLAFLLGAIGARLCRRFPRADVATIIVAGFLSYTVFVWWCYDPDVWSWRHPIMTAIYQLGPFVLLFVAPALIGFKTVARFCLRQHAKGI